MKTKAAVKMIIDILMTLGLFLVSGYQFWGDVAHEWLGAGMFTLFIAHHVLNLNWYKNLFRGQYSPSRLFQLMVNLGLLTVMLMLMYSGIILSRYVFTFLPIESGLALARRLHILSAYWGFILMSLHVGMHWNWILGMAKKRASIKIFLERHRKIFSVISVLIAGYGVFVFVNRDFLKYMLLKSEFVFLDYGEPLGFFYLDYLAIMGLGIVLAQCILKRCRKEQ